MADQYAAWITRAESSPALNLRGDTDHVLYEDLCFQLQQAVEKAFKGLLIYYDIEPPLTHSFAVLLKRLAGVLVYPQELERTVELEDYAVQTRYPGDYTPVDEGEYREACEIAGNAVRWVKSHIAGAR